MKVYRKMKVQKGNTMEQPNITGLVDHDILLETKNEIFNIIISL